MAESVREKLERAKRMVEHSRGYDMRPLITEALAQLDEMERDHEAIHKAYICFPKLKHVTRDLYEIESPHPRVEYESGEFLIAVTEGVSIGHLIETTRRAILGKKGET